MLIRSPELNREAFAMSNGQLARQRSSSTSTRPSIRANTPVVPRSVDLEYEFEPCAATASLFLFTQGSSIVCLHHDTLALERTFELHKERILFVSVDNVSDSPGQYVVSYDAGQTAIIWDLSTGEERARFASYEPIRVAAWMKNGNIAFGTKTPDQSGQPWLTIYRQLAGKCYIV